MSNESLIEFPCDFPIKIMGLNCDNIRQAVHAVAAMHVGGCADDTITERASRTGKYVAFTLSLTFESQDQIDNVYRQLTAIDGVSMVL